MPYSNDIPKHKKKKNNSSRSDKRSNHKHIYEKVITENFLGFFAWAERCSVCGKFKNQFSFDYEGLIEPSEDRALMPRNAYTAQELRQKFPNTRIYKFKSTPLQSFDMEEILPCKNISKEESDESI